MKLTVRSMCLLIPVLAGCSGAESETATRQAEVASIGASVMPFNLDATTHVFEKTDVGGVQQVITKGDLPEQARLIREHLRAESVRFAAGDFHDPEMIHGGEMPGLHELVMGHERLVVQYEAIEGGAQILYSSADPTLVVALHAWFDAQLTDHGVHAQAHP